MHSEHAQSIVERSVGNMLGLIRETLELDVVFVGEFVNDQRVFRHVSKDDGMTLIEVGGAHPLDLSLCWRIANGRFPALVCNVREVVDEYELPPIYMQLGGHVGVPVRLGDGRLYGSLCGASTKACPHLQAQDVKRMEIAAQAIARLLAQAEGRDVIALDD
ncbi:MAG: GAF domain-containing protein [Proteobacteria bacterium]|nr:GAF domain-containing protein [Pseudomonadota bacterium]